jgi:hypothetical protein
MLLYNIVANLVHCSVVQQSANNNSNTYVSNATWHDLIQNALRILLTYLVVWCFVCSKPFVDS